VAIASLTSSGGVASIAVTDPGTGYTKPPSVTITGDGTGATGQAFHSYLSMESPAAAPTTDMKVRALLIDDPSMTPIEFDLTFSQKSRPFFVWGTGENPESKGGGLQASNFYFSLTRLEASGTITLDGEKFDVEGVTWMDHEYGAFGTAANPVKWILQDMQLDNGYSVSNVGIISDGKVPQLDVTSQGYATLQDAKGNMYLAASSVTPIGPTWTSDTSGVTYFTKFRVEIPTFEADIEVTTLLDGQEFTGLGTVYEGVARAKGTFQGADVAGDGWIEQNL
jgi:predicted secreted hydrolase